MVQLLLNKYRTINNFNAAISEAVLRGHGHIVKLGLNMCTGAGLDYTELYSKALVGASNRGREEIVKMLLDAGLPANKAVPGVNSALHLAAGGGFEQIVKLLLEAGANANAIGGHGDSALQIASSAGHDTVVRLLLKLTPVRVDIAASSTAARFRKLQKMVTSEWWSY